MKSFSPVVNWDTRCEGGARQGGNLCRAAVVPDRSSADKLPDDASEQGIMHACIFQLMEIVRISSACLATCIHYAEIMTRYATVNSRNFTHASASRWGLEHTRSRQQTIYGEPMFPKFQCLKDWK